MSASGAIPERPQVFSEVGAHHAVDDEVDAAVDDGEVADNKIRQPLLHWSKVEHVVFGTVEHNRNPIGTFKLQFFYFVIIELFEILGGQESPFILL